MGDSELKEICNMAKEISQRLKGVKSAISNPVPNKTIPKDFPVLENNIQHCERKFSEIHSELNKYMPLSEINKDLYDLYNKTQNDMSTVFAVFKHYGYQCPPESEIKSQSSEMSDISLIPEISTHNQVSHISPKVNTDRNKNIQSETANKNCSIGVDIHADKNSDVITKINPNFSPSIDTNTSSSGFRKKISPVMQRTPSLADFGLQKYQKKSEVFSKKTEKLSLCIDSQSPIHKDTDCKKPDYKFPTYEKIISTKSEV